MPHPQRLPPGNAVRRADGEVVLIDWDGAGLGAAMLDLGFLLITADTYTPDVPTVGDSDTRVNAIVDGYSEYRRPEMRNWKRLADAIRFRVTFINAVTFARQYRARGVRQSVDIMVGWVRGSRPSGQPSATSIRGAS